MGFRVAGITVSDLNVDDGVTGQLTVSSREKDAQVSLAKLLARRTYTVRKLQILMPTGSNIDSLILASDGSIRSDKELDLDVISDLRDALPKIQQR
jgi:hypothetical protein